MDEKQLKDIPVCNMDQAPLEEGRDTEAPQIAMAAVRAPAAPPVAGSPAWWLVMAMAMDLWDID